MTATAVIDRRLAHPPAPGRRSPGQPGLTREEEAGLARRAASGDRQSRDRLVEANLGLIHTIAREFLGRGLELDDLVGEGHLGLFRAVERFDARHGTRFTTYAAYWIKEAIRRALMNTAPTIRLPAYLVRLLTRWRRAERATRSQKGREPGFEEVADALGLGEPQRAMVTRALKARWVGSGSASDERGSERSLAEIRDRQERVDGRAEAEDELALLRRQMERLDDRERTVLSLRYGLEGECLTHQQIGRRLRITREWSRKLELRALGKLGEDCTADPNLLKPGDRSHMAARVLG